MIILKFWGDVSKKISWCCMFECVKNKCFLIYINKIIRDTLVCVLCTIVAQLSKCLKFEPVWGVLTDQMISV